MNRSANILSFSLEYIGLNADTKLCTGGYCNLLKLKVRNYLNNIYVKFTPNSDFDSSKDGGFFIKAGLFDSSFNSVSGLFVYSTSREDKQTNQLHHVFTANTPSVINYVGIGCIDSPRNSNYGQDRVTMWISNYSDFSKNVKTINIGDYTN